MPELQMPSKIVLYPYNYLRFVVVGCGGTGSYLVRDLARIVSVCNAQYNRHDGILLYDGDVVEQHNLARQNFILPDIGKNKAQVLADRYGRSFGVDISCITEYLRADNQLFMSEDMPLRSGVSILIGCVDNNKTRCMMHNIYRDSPYVIAYIDGGNEEFGGQVVFSTRNAYTMNGAQVRLGNRDGKIKDVVELFDMKPDDRHPDDLSCAERAVHAPQNIATNMMSAFVLFNYCNIILNAASKLQGVNLSTYYYENTERFGQVTGISANVSYFNSHTGQISTQGFDKTVNDRIEASFTDKKNWDKLHAPRVTAEVQEDQPAEQPVRVNHVVLQRANQ